MFFDVCFSLSKRGNVLRVALEWRSGPTEVVTGIRFLRATLLNALLLNTHKMSILFVAELIYWMEWIIVPVPIFCINISFKLQNVWYKYRNRNVYQRFKKPCKAFVLQNSVLLFILMNEKDIIFWIHCDRNESTRGIVFKNTAIKHTEDAWLWNKSSIFFSILYLEVQKCWRVTDISCVFKHNQGLLKLITGCWTSLWLM